MKTSPGPLQDPLNRSYTTSVNLRVGLGGHQLGSPDLRGTQQPARGQHGGHTTTRASPVRTITNGSILSNSFQRNASSTNTSPGHNRNYFMEVNGNIPGATSPPQGTPAHNQPLNGHQMNSANLRQSPGSPMNSGNIRQQPLTPEQHRNPNDPKFEVPLPFGYHLDLDFLRVCSASDAASEESLLKLKELRKMRRKQRKTLETLMGLRSAESSAAKSSSYMRGSAGNSLMSRSATASLERPHELDLSIGGVRRFNPDLSSQQLVRDALRESMISFQETLDQYKSSPDKSPVSDFDLMNGITSTPRDKKLNYSTFPRAQLGSPDGMDKLSRHLSNSSISSVSTNSSALPYNVQISPEAYLASLPSSIPYKLDVDIDTNSIGSISSEMSTNTLRNVREQMARSLVKLKEYEKQVEAIPMMQMKLSVLKEEKRLLILKLKAREARLRKERGEEEDIFEDARLYEEAMDTDDEDIDFRGGKMSDSLRRRYPPQNLNRRARSESPYAKCATAQISGSVHPEEFISFQRKRSTSCGFNSDDPELHSDNWRHQYYHNQQQHQPLQRNMKSTAQLPLMLDAQVNTDDCLLPVKEPEIIKPDTRERASNTDPRPRSPQPPRKVSHSTNTTRVRTMGKGTGTDIRMEEMISKAEMEAKIEAAVARTEEDIMSCPLLQKALAKVEEEAVKGPEPKKEVFDQGTQVGRDNLRPFTIDRGLTCKLDEENGGRRSVAPENMVDSWCQITPKPIDKVTVACGITEAERDRMRRTIGVGDCKIIEDPKEPSKFRTVGVCTEKWVEVIRASKQTDTEDFAFKDTESPRVADMVFEPVERPERKSTRASPWMRNSPSVSRRSSTNSPSVSRKSSAMSITATTNTVPVHTKTISTMTDPVIKAKMKDAKVEVKCEVKSVSTSAMLGLPLTTSTGVGGSGPRGSNLPPGSPLSTPDVERPPVNMSICEKCDKDIQKAAEAIIPGPGSDSIKTAEETNVLAPKTSSSSLAAAANNSTSQISPPSADMPWLSKIPRPIELPEAERATLIKSSSNSNLLKSNSSSNLYASGSSASPVNKGAGGTLMFNRSQSPLTRSKSNLEKTTSYLPQRSMSNLDASTVRKLVGGSSTPPPGRRNVGTPPPHPNLSAAGSKRAPSPLTRSSTPNQIEKKSLIPKFSPQLGRKTPDQSGRKTPDVGDRSKTPDSLTSSMTRSGTSLTGSKIPTASPSAPLEPGKSLIPRVVTPPALRKMFPKKEDKLAQPDRNVVRKHTLNKSSTGVATPDYEPSSPSTPSVAAIPQAVVPQQQQQQNPKVFNRQMTRSIDETLMEESGEETETIDDTETGPGGSKMSDSYPLPGAALFTPINDNRDNALTIISKAEPSKEMMAALKVLQDSAPRGAPAAARNNAQTTNAVNIIQQEWFKLSSTKTSNPLDVEDYLDCIENMSKDLLEQVVSMVDVNGNTALHYSVSHGNFDVVSVLLDSKVANPNILNKAGYTCSMLISLAQIKNETHRSVVRRLFSMADVNIRASQHGQTALMLAVSHGRLDMVKLLEESGADVNIRDEDGSTALMCAAEHGHIEIVKLLMQHPDINLSATDNDGLTALSVAMEAGHRMKRTPSRNSTATPTSGRTTSSPIPPTPPVRSRRNSSS